MDGDHIGHFAGDVGVEDGLSFGSEENGQGNAPSALAADAPVGTRFDSAENTVSAPGGQPVDLINGFEGALAHGIDADEELGD